MMPIKNLKLADAGLVEQLRQVMVKCCEDYYRKRGDDTCPNCPYRKICEAHTELFWEVQERDSV